MQVSIYSPTDKRGQCVTQYHRSQSGYARRPPRFANDLNVFFSVLELHELQVQMRIDPFLFLLFSRLHRLCMSFSSLNLTPESVGFLSER